MTMMKSHISAMLLRSARLLVLAGIVSLGAGCQPPPAREPEEGVTDVMMQNLAFEPREVAIRVGERVRWTNLEAIPIPHTATSGVPGDADGIWDSGTLFSGESFTRTFDEPGEFVYFCRFHPFVPAMVGATVIVEAEQGG